MGSVPQTCHIDLEEDPGTVEDEDIHGPPHTLGRHQHHVGACSPFSAWRSLIKAMANSGVSYHNAYRFATWGEGDPVTGIVYKRQPEGGWIATVDGTEVKVLGVLRRETTEEAIRQAREAPG